MRGPVILGSGFNVAVYTQTLSLKHSTFQGNRVQFDSGIILTSSRASRLRYNVYDSHGVKGSLNVVIPVNRLCRNGHISQFFTNSFKLVFPSNAGIQYNINPLEDWITTRRPAFHCGGVVYLIQMG